MESALKRKDYHIGWNQKRIKLENSESNVCHLSKLFERNLEHIIVRVRKTAIIKISLSLEEKSWLKEM
jgi:hypothetical protein